MLSTLSKALVGLSVLFSSTAHAAGSTYYNPIFPGWNSDPSCTQVNGIFFCAVSTFTVFPGLPIYASTDLINWRLVSHAWNRESQFPDIKDKTGSDQGGMYAPTLRYHKGLFHVICAYVTGDRVNESGLIGAVFKTEDPFSNDAWSDPVVYNATAIDPDLFWDEDGTVYLSTAGIQIQEIDLETGGVTEPTTLWNGTGGAKPEGPHIFQRNGYYYLLIAEGGTELNHMATIARSKNITGPYESYSANPILSNANTTEYFQTVGHADFFRDENNNWWGVSLATRSGPEWKVYPMGRETVLFSVGWSEDWPFPTRVRGTMLGHELPPYNRAIPGSGPLIDAPDFVDFAPGSSLPSNFYSQRYWPSQETFQVSPPGHENQLLVKPSRARLTAYPNITDVLELQLNSSISFLGRKQTHTLFTYSVDLDFAPKVAGQEAGVTVFLTRQQHIDLSLAYAENSTSSDARILIFRPHADGFENVTTPATSYPLPGGWPAGSKIRLQIHTPNATHYAFTAAPAKNPNAKYIVGYQSAEVVSGGTGPFTGVLLGVYATCNAGNGTGPLCSDAGGEAYFSRWRYQGAAQQISATRWLPSVVERDEL